MVIITFIDENIPDYEILANNVINNMIVHIIRKNIDGLSFMYDIIQEYTNIEAVHILSHAVPGQFRLGNVTININTLSNYKYLESINKNFVEDGEILFYGCHLAAGEEGDNLIKGISNITNMKVTASTHAVGHPNLKGNWDLNYSTNLQHSKEIAINQNGQKFWVDVLTHYRGGSLYWSDEGANVIKLVITSYWRHDAHDVGLQVLFKPDLSNGNGVITNDIGRIAIDDDGDSYIDEDGDGNGIGTVTTVEIETSGQHYEINTQTFNINYSVSGTGSYIISMSTNARINTLQNDAANQSFGLETIVSPGSGNDSPKTSIPPILQVPINTNWLYNVPAIDPNSNTLSYSLVDLTDPENTSIYGTWTQIDGLTIDSDSGELSLDTTGFTIGHLYSVLIKISNGTTTIPVDFIIEFVDSIELPLIVDGYLDEIIFSGLNYDYSFVANIPSDPTIELTWTVVSALPQNLTYYTNVTNTILLIFSPSYIQIGEVYVINLSVTNNLNGATSYLNITFTIKENTIYNVINIFNCAIKNIVVECDRLTALEQILCIKEKRMVIWKNGQIKYLENKQNRNK